MKKTILTLLSLLLFPMIALALDPVGLVVDVSGQVEIDAFGTSSFIPMENGDSLYETSVIRTDYDSWAEIRIGDERFTVSPLSVTRISSFLSPRRAGVARLFGRLLGGFRKALAPPEEEVADFGGRASQAPETNSFGDLFFAGVDDEYEDGRDALDAGHFREAVEHFARIEYPDDGSFDIEQYYVDYSLALAGMGDFDAAVDTAFSFLLREPSAEAVSSLPARLRMLVGVCAYYSGRDELSFAAIDSYVDEVGIRDADGEALAIRLDLGRVRSVPDAPSFERRVRAERPDVQPASNPGP